jgi:outer membrane lipoprotein-sorting protein
LAEAVSPEVTAGLKANSDHIHISTSEVTMNLGLALLVTLMGLSTVMSATNKATDLLERADEFRATFDAFVVRVKLTNTDRGRVVDEAEFEVSIKDDNSLVRFLSVRSKGQSMLMRGDDMWLFLPAVARPVRITPIQRLMGNVSNGDLARLRYATDYDATLDGDAVVDGQECDVLDLRARRKAATYQRVRYFVRKSDARPIRADYFLTSGKPVKRAAFSELRQMAGRPILSRLVIEDAERPESKTTIDFVTITLKPLPDKLFNVMRSEG